MKKLIYRIFLFAALFAAIPSVQAAPSFSGAIGGSAGFDINVPLDKRSADFKVPLAGFAAVQANLAEWCVVRGEMAIDASDFEFDDIFGSAKSAIKLNELSLVLIRRAVTASSFFSLYLGSYEQIGSDAFMMRQFGIAPTSSKLLESHTNLAGVPVLKNKGAGLSYIVNFDKAPIATGAYLYFGKNRAKDWTLNLDARFAFVANLFSMDLLAGISSPLQDKYNNADVVLMIDTICVHGGVNILAGSKFTHSLLLQAGVKDIVVKGKNAGKTVGDEFNLLVEPRINFNKFRMSLSIYAYDAESIKETVYLANDFGAALSFYKDDIESKNGFMTAGVHLLGALGGKSAWDFFTDGKFDGVTYNAYISPFIEVPLAQTASFEAMAQIGVCDLTGSRSLNFKVCASAKKRF